MNYRETYSVKGFDALRGNPVRWFVSELTVYVTAAVVVGLAFILGSAVYAYLWAAPQLDVKPFTTDDVMPIPPVESPATAPGPALGSLKSELISARKVATFNINSSLVEAYQPVSNDDEVTETKSGQNTQFVMIDNRGILHLPNSDLRYNFNIPGREDSPN